MEIKEVHKWEKAVVVILNIIGWDLKWIGDEDKSWDAEGLSPKNRKVVIEMKFREKYYEEKLLEKYKYDVLMKLPDDVVKLYFVNDPYHLLTIQPRIPQGRLLFQSFPNNSLRISRS